MREDIISILKNAIEHGGNPSRIAQSLINWGYPAADVQQALSSLSSTISHQSQIPPQSINQPFPSISLNQTSPQTSQDASSNQTQAPQVPMPSQSRIKSLPTTKNHNPGGTGKIMVSVIILLILVGSLIAVIIFKDALLKLIGA